MGITTCGFFGARILRSSACEGCSAKGEQWENMSVQARSSTAPCAVYLSKAQTQEHRSCLDVSRPFLDHCARGTGKRAKVGT